MLFRALFAKLNRSIVVRHLYLSEALLISIATLPDGTDIVLRFLGESLDVDVKGTVLKIADILELFAWLGAACRVSPITTPTFSIVDSFTLNDRHLVMSYGYHTQTLQDGSSVRDGECWHDLFRNPVIVSGFPILARDHSERGLEIPLGIMARLGGADRATIFDDQVLIKGFSTMFVPTKRTHDSILWHFIRHPERISYLEAKKFCSAANVITTYSALESTRNFLGWSASVLLHTGAYICPPITTA